MKIETAYDYNLRLGECGCCHSFPRVAPPIPVVEYKFSRYCGYRIDRDALVPDIDKVKLWRKIIESTNIDSSYQTSSSSSSTSFSSVQIQKRSKDQVGNCVSSYILRTANKSQSATSTSGNPANTTSTSYTGLYRQENGTIIAQAGVLTRSETNPASTTVTAVPLTWASHNWIILATYGVWNYNSSLNKFTETVSREGETTTRSVQFIEEITDDEIIADMDATEWGPSLSGSFQAKRHSLLNLPSQDFYNVRVRFRIPYSHTGSKFYISYDIAEFPENGDPFFFQEDQMVTWAGPGTGNSDDDSWLTPWVDLNAPDNPGERRIVNLRYSGLSSTRYGLKPEIYGESFSPQ